MRFERIWLEQFKATKAIRERFGVGSALDYLVGEKLMMFSSAAQCRPEFALELPKFLAAIWQMFNQYELAGYIASLKPAERRQLRKLLFME
ncbi:MAG: hypothetical protein ACREDR_17920 [Blastocatellia bacterium]